MAIPRRLSKPAKGKCRDYVAKFQLTEILAEATSSLRHGFGGYRLSSGRSPSGLSRLQRMVRGHSAHVKQSLLGRENPQPRNHGTSHTR